MALVRECSMDFGRGEGGFLVNLCGRKKRVIPVWKSP